MKMNKNLKNLEPYDAKITPIKAKRLHFNEAHSPILQIEILQKNILNLVHQYPEIQYINFIKKASKFYQISTKYITPTNGSDEAISLITSVFCNPNDKCMILFPTFSVYELQAKICGIKIVKFPLSETQNDFKLNINLFIQNIKKHRPHIVFLPNPLANVGNIIDRQNILKLIQTFPTIFFIIDEAYIEFSQERSMIFEVKNYKNLIVLRTLSKFFGLAGARIGFIFSNFNDEINKAKDPFNISSITLEISLNFFENIDKSIMKKRFDENLLNKKNMINWLKTFNEIEKIYTSYANFLFIKLNCDSKKFEKKLLSKFNIQIKSFSGKLQNFCRISF